jgi:hypothetical protein
VRVLNAGAAKVVENGLSFNFLLSFIFPMRRSSTPFDHERAEVDLANAIRLLRVHLVRMRALAGRDLSKAEKERLIKTANLFASRTARLMVEAREIEQMLPRRV